MKKAMMNLKIWMTACSINLHMEINSDSRILLANDTKACAFHANFRSGHYNVVGTGLYQMIVPARATIEA